MDELASDSARGTTSPRRGLASKLIARVIAVSLIPLLLVGAIAVFAVLSLADQADREVKESGDRLADDVVATQLQGEAASIITEVERFLDERIGDAADLAATTEVLDAAEQGAADADAQGLVGLDAATAEARVPDHSLLVSPELDAALAARVEDSAFIGSILVTDRNGFTVASSAPASELVLGDDAWWTEAFDTGGSVSPFRFDATGNRFAVDIAVPIEPASPSGVLRMSINVSYIQDLADALALRSGSDVSILNQEGLLLADTATGHDLTRIMNAELSLDPVSDADIIDAQADTAAAGTFRTDTSVVGFARSTESTIGSAVDLLVVLDQDEAVALAPLSGLDSLRDDLQGTSRTLMLVLLALTLAAIVGSFLVARLLVRSIVRPILKLRDAANRVAEVELPRVVDEIDQMEEGDAAPELEPIELDTGDEVEELARAFTSVQDTAVRLAAEQADARRRNVAQAFVSMGRRNQNLIGRQLEFIEQLEQTESDPQTLSNLFKLDHLATRLRRNAESLLVLAGEEPARRWGVPVSIIDVVRSAASEIEDFPRVELSRLEDQPVQGSVVSELSHLLAEIVENALSFSPPNSQVLVAGRRRPEGYELAVVDRGIGMTAEELAEANERLAHPAEFDRAPTQRLGLFVVGRLAARHGVRVKMVPSASGQGVTVLLLLPHTLLEDAYHPDAPPHGLSAEPAPTETASASPSPEARFAPPSADEPAAVHPPVAPALGDPSIAAPALPRRDGTGTVPAEPALGPAPSAFPAPPLPRREGSGVEEAPPRHAAAPVDAVAAAVAPVEPAPAVQTEVHTPEPSIAEAWTPDAPVVESVATVEPGPTVEPAPAPFASAEPPPLPRRHGPGVDHDLGATTGARPADDGVRATAGAEPLTSLFSRRDDSPEVTPSGLRRRRPADPLPVTSPRPMTVDEVGPERDPEAVRATLRRFMTGVGHGRRLAGDTDDTTDPIPTGGGHDE